MSSSFLDMSLVSFVELIHVKSNFSYVFTKLILLSSHSWLIISSGFWWDKMSSLIFSNLFFHHWCYHLTLYPSLFLKQQVYYMNWNSERCYEKFFTLLWHYYCFMHSKIFHYLLLICEIMVLRLLFLDLEKPYFRFSFLTTYTLYLFIFLLKDSSSI